MTETYNEKKGAFVFDFYDVKELERYIQMPEHEECTRGMARYLLKEEISVIDEIIEMEKERSEYEKVKNLRDVKELAQKVLEQLAKINIKALSKSIKAFKYDNSISFSSKLASLTNKGGNKKNAGNRISTNIAA